MIKGTKVSFITLWKLNDWGMYNRRNEALLWELSRRYIVESVLHIEHISLKGLIYRIKRWLTTKDKQFRRVYRYHIQKGFSFKPIVANDRKTFFIYSVVVCYSGNLSIFKKLSDFIMSMQYYAVNKYFVHSKKNVVLIAYPPSDYLPYAINAIKHDLLIADFVDDALERATDPAEKRQIEDNYKSIFPRCEWIFSTSPSINHKYRVYAKREIEFLPNGADVNCFQADHSGSQLHKSDHQVVGYVGTINKTMDADLLEYTVSCFPDVDFILIGFAVNEQLKDINHMMNKYKNFYFLGEKNYLDAASYIENLDVLISFKKNDHTTAGGDSQKIYEYLATGKPIVTTPVPPANRFSDLMYVAYSKVQFVEYLRIALKEDDPGIREKRVRTAMDNSWARRGDVILDRVTQLL